MIGDIRIKAKSNGLDLYEHSEAVKDTALIFNTKAQFGIDYDVIYWASILHDIGKANPWFLKNMEANDFNNVMRHEIASVLFIKIVPEEIRDVVAYIILSHHKSIDKDDRSLIQLFDTDTDNLYKNHIGNIAEWGKVVKNYLKCHYNINVDIPSYDECVEIINYFVEKYYSLKKGYVLARGLLMMSDHFASCFDQTSERLEKISHLFTTADLSCYKQKNERYPLSLIDKDPSKKHSLTIAPTGVGKTNFVMKMCEGKRVFYTLPYQASINSMYQRLKNDTNTTVGIQHSSLAALSFIDDTTKILSSFYGLPITVITPFQILKTILRFKGYEATILDLKGQAVIFDELHTYNSMTRTYILRMIEFLLTIDCEIHICTATMPTYMQNDIIKLIGKDNLQIVRLPKITLERFNRHRVHTIDSISVDDIIKRYKNNEKVLVVKNTIKGAQALYRKVKEQCPGAKILLLHSKFKRKERALLEGLLLNEFNGKKEPCILISTQVVEVSIDISFDVLFTDCADIMSLIQRFGRVNRHRADYTIIKDIYIAKVLYTAPYDENITKKTYEVFSEIDGQILQESEIQGLIDRVHSEPILDVYNNATPYNDKGEWKCKEYSHIVNSSVSKELEFTGYFAITKSDYESYKVTLDKDMEIPISHEISGAEPIIKNGKVIGFIIPDMKYTTEYGLEI